MNTTPITTRVKAGSCGCSHSGPLTRRKSNAPSRKKSKGYYAKVKKGSGTGSKAGGGMTARVLLNIVKTIQGLN